MTISKNKNVDLLIFAGDSYDYDTAIEKSIRTLGAHKIAHMARKFGYTAQVIAKTQFLSLEKLIEISEQFVGPDTIIAIGATYIAIPLEEIISERDSYLMVYINTLRNAVNYFKEKYNNKVLIGGANAPAFEEMFNADYVITGFAENKVVEFLNKVKNHGMYRVKENEWTISACNHRWHKTDCIVKNEVLPLETARGCIFSCKFCAIEMLGKKSNTYARNIDLIREELVYNYEQFGTTHYVLVDDTFNDNDVRNNAWCDMLDTLPFKIKYSCYLRLDLLFKYQDTARRLYETGLTGCHFGIESFHQAASKAIGKAFSYKKAKTFLPYVYNTIFEGNVRVTTSLVIGLPGEPEESIRETLAWVNEHPYLAVWFSGLYLINNEQLTAEELAKQGITSLSEFSKNSAKYGYRFPFKDKPYFWETDIMNFDQSLDIAAKLNKEIGHRAYPNSWTIMPYLSNTKLTVKDVVKYGDNKCKRLVMPARFKEIETYIDKMSNLTLKDHGID